MMAHDFYSVAVAVVVVSHRLEFGQIRAILDPVAVADAA